MSAGFSATMPAPNPLGLVLSAARLVAKYTLVIGFLPAIVAIGLAFWRPWESSAIAAAQAVAWATPYARRGRPLAISNCRPHRSRVESARSKRRDSDGRNSPDGPAEDRRFCWDRARGRRRTDRGADARDDPARG